MKRFLSPLFYLLLQLGDILGSLAIIGIAIYGIYQVVRVFIDNGVIWGLISIPIMIFAVGLVQFIFHIISAPLMILLHRLFKWSISYKEENERP